MRLRAALLPIALGLLALSSATPIATSTPPAAQAEIASAKPSKKWPGQSSDNWSGYGGVTSGSNNVTATSATWTVPSVPAKTGYSSTWIGVDGLNNSSLIQVGTEQDWAKHKFNYYAWYEILPAAETIIPSFTVSPGDTMSASVAQQSGTTWVITLTDVTTFHTFSTTKTYTGPGASAEWIQEAPTGPKGNTLKLAQYSQFEFSNIKLGLNSAAPTNLALAYPGEAIAMFKGQKQISTPSQPTANVFNIAYGKLQPPAP